MVSEFWFPHVFSSKEDRSTDREEAAMAAEAIQGCSTKPTGMNTPAENSVAVVTHTPQHLPVSTHLYLQRWGSPGSCR